MSKSNYDADNIESLSGIEHIKKYPGMYLGNSGASGLQQSVKEIVTNSIDEALNGHGDEIIVTLLEDDKISIKDRGRGMPLGINKKLNKCGIDCCVAVPNAGGKYNKENYASSGGMYGVGASATNAVSSEMTVIVRQGGKIHKVEFKNTKRFHPKDEKKTDIIGDCAKKDTGTEVIYRPDPEIMEETKFDKDAIMNYLKQLSYLMAGTTFKFIDARKGKEETETYYTKNGLTDYIEEIMGDRQRLISKPIHIPNIVLPLEKGQEFADEVEVAFSYAKDHKSNVYLFVNKNSVPNGGTAVTGFKMGFTKALNDIAKVLGIMRPKERPLRSSDVEEGLVAVISLKMSNPELEGQTKNKLNNTKLQGSIQSKIGDILKVWLEENPKETGKIADKALLGRRAREASLKARQLVMSKAGTSSQTPPKLKGCKSNKPELCEVMLVEGDSASTGITFGRDVETQAFLPLRGKVKNVEKMSTLVEVLENNEYKDINNLLGCGFGDSFDISKLKYHKIIILTDADVDGLHIAALLLTYFYRCYKPLLEAGHIYICVPPLYRVRWGKNGSVYLLNDAALDEWKAKNPKIKDYTLSRFKGLGEMKPAELAETCVQPANRQLVQVSVADAEMAENAITKLMGSDGVQDRKRFFQSGGEVL